ncbi:lamin tail domain-containing protein [Streptomyces sp. NPDC088358]|uniref:lamin tail domain-containing protein n=1 Tax=Streptomyces sp. NPDC088358 TaxID=3365857 RepID=UPI00382DB800
MQIFKGFHRLLRARKAVEIEAEFGARLVCPVGEFNASRHVGDDSPALLSPPILEQVTEFFDLMPVRGSSPAGIRAPPTGARHRPADGLVPQGSAQSSRSTRRIAAATLAADAALGAAALPASAQSSPHQAAAFRSGVVISDVQSDSPGFDDRGNRSLKREWIDITNTSRRSVNLDGWTLSDEGGHTYTVRHYRLDGRSSVRVHTGGGRDTYRDVYQDRRNYVWDNRSDTATLRNDHGRFIDDASWGRHHRGDHGHPR